MSKTLREKIFEWAVPLLLGAAVKFLAGINSEMREIRDLSRYAVLKADDHEKRLDNIEEFLFRAATGRAP